MTTPRKPAKKVAAPGRPTPHKPAKKVATSGRPRTIGLPRKEPDPVRPRTTGERPVVKVAELRELRTKLYQVEAQLGEANETIKVKIWRLEEQDRKIRDLQQLLEEEPEEDDRELEAQLANQARVIEGKDWHIKALEKDLVERDAVLARIGAGHRTLSERANTAERRLHTVIDMASASLLPTSKFREDLEAAGWSDQKGDS